MLTRQSDWARAHTNYIRFKAYTRDDIGRGCTTIEKHAALSLMGLPCSYCGLEKAGGLDRRDSAKGHTEENVVPCCMWCNSLLSDLPPEAKDLLKPGLKKIREAGIFGTWVIPQMRNRRSA